MKSVKETKTQVNLMKAFAGESQARNRYTYFASTAKKEGYKQIEFVFTETAEQEKEHAQRLFRFMDGPAEIEIVSSFPAGPERDTLSNLKDAAAGENHEHSSMSPEFAKVAEEEGFPEIASAMKFIAVAEKFHEARFLGFAKNIAEGTVFKKGTKVQWRCRNCGCVVESAEAPHKCPACDHPKDYFEPYRVDW
ncbi:MAG: rubrerythrin family protein [Synergistaceae bacterium]|jgi:rubrerythrin|nr:rubrerythrin family protein [Synergistaceae bacterium]